MSTPAACPASPTKKAQDACPFTLVDQEPENTSLASAIENCPTARSEGTDNLGENDVIYVLSFEFLGGCPFASKAKDDIEDMMTQSSVDHPITHEVKINNLNHYLPETKSKKNQDFLSDPQLAMAMKEGTKVVHSAAENSVFTKRFMSGTISTDEYGRYINSLYFVYKTMEDLLAQHKENPLIKLVYFPYELTRGKSLIKDLEYYYGKDRVAEITDFKNVTPAVKTYINALKDAAEKNPALLIAHSYSRYLGDLSGGQILAKRLKKHVLKRDVTDASWDSYHGLEFYNFDHIRNHNEFKNLYRQRLDESPVTQYVKDLIVAEAIYSFELNIALFDEIQALSDSKELHPTLDYDDTESVDSTLGATGETKNAFLPNADWLVGFATGMATFAVGLSLYHRLSDRL
ncbi:hypothetical protein HMPREF1544_11021 [Mucor circinelloides 1006PhL]|uniref:heme oxygenase (biliverdin-producing) n=1 Tax=Mucor circinelloides f. circinelloides (strain 1006PhL) TaxID=1220926 RepID=S2J270_MUCC1|nr:hypothetical protein HMPREF1544_11021 [Mucor circinelloides 1006PhL]